VWECDLRNNPERVKKAVRKFLCQQDGKG
jgi:hypothetical protein